jgi:hypothetical protein
MIINRGRKWYQSIGLPLKEHWHEILGNVFVCEIEPNRFLEYVYKTVAISFAIFRQDIRSFEPEIRRCDYWGYAISQKNIKIGELVGIGFLYINQRFLSKNVSL